MRINFLVALTPWRKGSGAVLISVPATTIQTLPLRHLSVLEIGRVFDTALSRAYSQSFGVKASCDVNLFTLDLCTSVALQYITRMPLASVSGIVLSGSELRWLGIWRYWRSRICTVLSVSAVVRPCSLMSKPSLSMLSDSPLTGSGSWPNSN